MESSLIRYTEEVVEFLNADTLKAIDYGVLDIGHVRNHELKRVLTFLEDMLTLELELNYLENRTGCFRVSVNGECWCYKERNNVIEAESLVELKKQVISQNRIWYVFDDALLKNASGRKM